MLLIYHPNSMDYSFFNARQIGNDTNYFYRSYE